MSNCLICGGSLVNSRLGKGLVKCAECGFVTTNLNMSTEELKSLYSEDYFHGEEYADYTNDKDILIHNFKKRLKDILKYVKDRDALFEIGCAYGFFLTAAKDEFNSVAGIDISKDAVEYACSSLEVRAVAGDYAQFESNDKYDCICMWDVIEHLSEPDKYISHAYSQQKEGGIICITTGDVGSLNARLRGKNWRQIHPPTHLHYFDKTTITKLLNKNGYAVECIEYPTNIISVKTALYTIFCLRHDLKGVYSFFDKIGITKINIPLYLHDYMFVIARK